MIEKMDRLPRVYEVLYCIEVTVEWCLRQGDEMPVEK